MLRSSLIRQDYSSTSANLLAGGLASPISQTIVVPTDLISQRMAIDRAARGMRHHLVAVWRQGGVWGFYQGYLISISTYTPASAIWWAMYGGCKPYLTALFIGKA